MNQISKKIKYNLSDGTSAYFSRNKFKAAIYSALVTSGKKTSQQAFLEEMADTTGNSFSAIKHWLAGHNAPSDLEKLLTIAVFLDVELTDLLETETENKSMNNTVAPVKAIDFTETKNTVRDLYIRMADYIELFRNCSVNYMGTELLAEAFPTLYTAIMHSRLDLPRTIFTHLSSFAVNYLQQMVFFIGYVEAIDSDNFVLKENIQSADQFVKAYSYAFEVPEICPWFENRYISIDEGNKDFCIFKEALEQHFNWDDMYDIPNEVIINTAYSRLEEIFKEYLVQ